MTPKGYEESVSNRMVIVFAWSAILLWAITGLSSILAKGGMTFYITAAVCIFLAFVSVFSMFFGIGWYIIASVRSAAPAGQTVNGGVLAVLSLMLLTGSGALAIFGSGGIRVFYVLLPLIGLLYLLWSVYPRRVFTLYITLIPVVFCICFLYKPSSTQGQRMVWGAVGLGIALVILVLSLAFQGKRHIALLGAATQRGKNGAIYGGAAVAVAAAWIFGSITALILAIAFGLFLITVLVCATIRLMGAGENVPMEPSLPMGGRRNEIPQTDWDALFDDPVFFKSAVRHSSHERGRDSNRSHIGNHHDPAPSHRKGEQRGTSQSPGGNDAGGHGSGGSAGRGNS